MIPLSNQKTESDKFLKFNENQSRDVEKMSFGLLIYIHSFWVWPAQFIHVGGWVRDW